MTRSYKIGERVRIARSDFHQEPVGHEAVVHGRGAFRMPHSGVVYEYALVVKTLRHDGYYYGHGWELEPVVPDPVPEVEEAAHV